MGQELPNEVAENILAHTPVESLTSLCSSNRQYYDLCSDPSLWRVRFRDEGLPPIDTLTTQGPHSPAYWIKTYKRALYAEDVVGRLYQELMDNPRNTVKVFFTGREEDDLLALSSVPGLEDVEEKSRMTAAEQREIGELRSLRDRVAERVGEDSQNVEDYEALIRSLESRIPFLQYAVKSGVPLTPEYLRGLFFRAAFYGLDIKVIRPFVFHEPRFTLARW